ncbi:MAG: response regulator [Woeseiaceae bacterium]|nr:response regulator [Woeseiaceae bacterium]
MNRTTPERSAGAVILLVEDEAAAREASRRYLEHLGYRVLEAPSAAEALRLAEAERPDVAVCDWHLGGGSNGVDAATELQQRYGAAIVFMTAYPIDELRDAAAEIDVTAFLRKPLSFAELTRAVERATAR